MEYSPSNSAGPTPTMIMDSGSDAACTEDRWKDMNEHAVQLTHSIFRRHQNIYKLWMNHRAVKS